MANQRRGRNSSLYASDGSLAYVREYIYDDVSGAAVERQPLPILPEERPQKKNAPVQAPARVAVSPFALAALAAAAVLLFMVITGYVRLYEAQAEVTDLKSELSALQEEQSDLKAGYESSVDLSRVELMATTELGMVSADSGRTVYVDLSTPDRAEIIHEDNTETAQNIFSAFSESLQDLSDDIQFFLQKLKQKFAG